MRNVLRIVSLIFLFTVGFAAFASSSEGGYPAETGVSNAVGQQNYGAQNYGAQNYGGDLDINYAYDYLAPYGNWVYMDPWGYVWCPRNMGYRWRPYSDGHWASTDYGWTWISDLEWGWIPFHYGRWGWDDNFGWFWVPGTVWGPAWVTWRSSDQYMGWAPFPPGLEFRAGMNFGSFGLNVPSRFWIFIGGSHFMDPDIYGSVLPYERNTTILGLTVMNNNFSFRGSMFINGGIGIDTIRRVTRRDVPLYAIQNSRQPGMPRVAGNNLQIYRPNFRSNPSVKPKTFLDRTRAQQVLAPARIFEPRQQMQQSAAEAAVRQRQTEERRLLQESQVLDMKALDQRRSEDQRKVQAPSEKARIQRDYQTKISEIGKQHQAEIQQMNERHKTDSEQVRRSVPIKKEAPPVKKKK
jgi:hypothetical protein